MPIAMTRVGMVAERVVRRFWPLWTVGFLALVPILMSWHELMSLEAFWTYVGMSGVALLIALIWGVRKFSLPTRAEAIARVDATMPGRPIAAMDDTQVIGAGDSASEAVWQAHVARMADRSRDARVVEPNLRIADRDPYGLRFIALLLFAAAFIFGTLWRQVPTIEIIDDGAQVLAVGPVWEGWIEPPTYTGKPTIYLQDVPAGPLRVPAGSKISVRLYGDAEALTVVETISTGTQDVGESSGNQQVFVATQSGKLAVEGENGIAWDVTVVQDEAPIVELIGPVEAEADGQMSQPFQAFDDYGIIAGTATIMLDIEAVDRRFGMAIDPDPRDALVLDLPMPYNGDRADFEEFLIENLSEHHLANLPVTITMEVSDAADQSGASTPEQIILPGRRFFQPFAKSIIELRRDLLWSKGNARRIVQVLKAISHRPEGLFSNETTYLRIRLITRQLDSNAKFGLTDASQTEIAQAMWELAIQLEDGTLADARERLRRAQERLAEAMRNGASDEEIAELMQELREATDDYMQLLADQMEPSEDGTDEPDSAQESFEFTQDELQALMDRIQELMEEGRMAEAEELMAQLNALLENMRITQGEGGGDGPRTPGQRSMQDLSETLRDQQDLSDDAFRDLQEQFNPGRDQGQEPGQDKGEQGENSGQEGQDSGEPGDSDGQQGQGQSFGEDSQGGMQSGEGAGGEGGAETSLAERQQALRDELNRQREGLPDLEGEAGDIARRALEQAEGAMDGAEEALRNGDLAEAIDRQAEAMNALRNGMRSLGQALARDEELERGQGGDQGDAARRSPPGRRDPLGRELGNTGQFGTDENLLQGEDVYRRAEELLDEIRRRSSEQERPEDERNYLRRLLDRF